MAFGTLAVSVMMQRLCLAFIALVFPMEGIAAVSLLIAARIIVHSSDPTANISRGKATTYATTNRSGWTILTSRGLMG